MRIIMIEHKLGYYLNYNYLLDVIDQYRGLLTIFKSFVFTTYGLNYWSLMLRFLILTLNL